MLKIEDSIKEELKSLRERAKIKRYGHNTNRFLTPQEVPLLVSRWLPTTNSLLLPEAIKTDLLNMPLYDCLSSWLENQGLAFSFPQEILRIARELLPPETDGEGL